jgi:hypothetical protein
MRADHDAADVVEEEIAAPASAPVRRPSAPKDASTDESVVEEHPDQEEFAALVWPWKTPPQPAPLPKPLRHGRTLFNKRKLSPNELEWREHIRSGRLRKELGLAPDPERPMPPLPARFPEDCPAADEPCPHVRCKYNLAARVVRKDGQPGNLKVVWPGAKRAVVKLDDGTSFRSTPSPPWDVDEIHFYIGHTCTLYAANEGERTVADVARLCNQSEKQTYTTIVRALAKIRKRAPWLADHLDGIADAEIEEVEARR